MDVPSQDPRNESILTSIGFTLNVYSLLFFSSHAQRVESAHSFLCCFTYLTRCDILNTLHVFPTVHGRNAHRVGNNTGFDCSVTAKNIQFGICFRNASLLSSFKASSLRPRLISESMKFVVELKIPSILSTLQPTKSRDATLTTGSPPHTVALYLL